VFYWNEFAPLFCAKIELGQVSNEIYDSELVALTPLLYIVNNKWRVILRGKICQPEIKHTGVFAIRSQ